MEIKVSIIIPVYNVAPYLDACLLSCVNQTFHDLEIIVVDDGSTDDSPQVIAAHAQTDKRIVTISKKNEGVALARKCALEVARGDFVFFLDGDDYLEINAIELLYDEMLRQRSDYVLCNYNVVNNQQYEVRRNSRMKGLSGEDFFLCMLSGGFELAMRLIRRSLFEGIIHKPLIIGEDLFVTMQIMLKVKHPVVVDACLYNYVKRASSIMNRNEEIIWTYKFDMVRSVLSLLDLFPYTQRIRERVYVMFYSLYLECISQKRMEIKTIFEEYYWKNKEIKSFLWRKRKDFYLIIEVFRIYPSLASLMAKMYLYMKVLRYRFIR